MTAWDAHRRATQRAALVAASVVAFVLCVPPVLGKYFYGMDLDRINLGMLCALQERLAGDGSLWLSPLLGNGGALLARPDAQLFYPPRWIALAFPPHVGVALEVVFHLALAAAAAAWLARTFGVRPFTAVAMGVSFALSGTAVDLLRHAHYLVAAAWLPMIWAGARACLQRGGRLPLLAAGVGGVGCLLGAEPQSFGVGLALIAFEGMRAVLRRRSLGRRALGLGAAAAAALLIGLAQWAPTLGELALSHRATGLARTEALSWSFSPMLWLGVVIPGVPSQYVQPITNLWQIAQGSVSATAPWNVSPYLGALVVIAALAGCAQRRVRSPALVALVATVFALGDQLPVLPALLKIVPLLGHFRYPMKYWLIASLAIALVAAHLIDGLARRPRWTRRLSWGGGSMAAALAGLAGGVWLNRAAVDQLAAQMRSGPAGGDLPTLSAALLASIGQALVPLCLALPLLLSPRLRRFLYGLIALEAIAVLPYALLIGPALTKLDREPLLPPSAVVCVQPSLAGRFFPFSNGRLEYHRALFARAHLVPELHACSGVRGGLGYSPLETSMGAALALGVRASSAAAVRALGCTHFLDSAPFVAEAPLDDLPLEFELSQLENGPRIFAGTWAFELPEPIPEVFIARSAALSTDEQAVATRIAGSMGSGPLLQIIDDPLRHLASPVLPAGEGAGRVELERGTVDRATLRANGVGGAVVGLRTPYLVGWSAQQNGKPLPTVRAAGHQLAVVVDDVALGPVELSYRPPRLTWGLVAAVAGMLLFAITILLVRRRPGFAS